MISPDTINDRFGKIERPYPWERGKMTVCIAGACLTLQNPTNAYEQAVLICTDSQSSSSLGRTETALKMRVINGEWLALSAGYETEIESALLALRNTFRSQLLVDETNIVSLVRTALQQRKRDKIDEFIRGRFGIPYS